MLFVQSVVIVENDTHTAIIGFVKHLIFKLGLFIFVTIKYFACTIILIHFLLEERLMWQFSMMKERQSLLCRIYS